MSDGFEMKDNTKEIEAALEQSIEKILTEWGEVAVGHAQLYVPVDTGNLKGSITYVTRENEMQVGTNVEYAEEVELNEKAHHTVGGHHYLKKSIANHMDEYKKIAERYLKS